MPEPRFALARQLAVVVLLMFARTHAAGAQPPGRACRTGPAAEQARAFHVEMMLDVDRESVERRASYGLTASSPDAVRVVADERICRRAAQEYYRYRIGPPERPGVLVLRIGDAYVVHGDERAGEWSQIRIYDAAWEPIGHAAR